MAIIIESQNPLDLPPRELQLLADEIRARDPKCQVEVLGRSPRQGTYGVTLYEVVVIWVPTAFTYATILQAAVKWARDRFAESPERPKSITIRAADDGTPLKSVVLRNADGEPEEQTLKLGDRRLPPHGSGADQKVNGEK